MLSAHTCCCCQLVEGKGKLGEVVQVLPVSIRVACVFVLLLCMCLCVIF